MVARIREDRADPESTCPYLRGTGTKTCNQGCWEEPGCWPDAARYPVNLRAISERIRGRADLLGRLREERQFSVETQRWIANLSPRRIHPYAALWPSTPTCSEEDR